jgi:hypothetical protein
MKTNRNMFARALVMFAAVAAAMKLEGTARLDALNEIGPYKSRGKGRGTPSRRYGNRSGIYKPHQGARECERRRMGGFYNRRSLRDAEFD